MRSLLFRAIVVGSFLSLPLADQVVAQPARIDPGLQAAASPLLTRVQMRTGGDILRPPGGGRGGSAAPGRGGFAGPGGGQRFGAGPRFGTGPRFGGGQRFGGGPRFGGGARFGGGYGGRFRHGHRGYGYGVGAGIAGLAAGALIGGAIASQAAPAYDYGYDTDYVAPPPPAAVDATDYCARRFKSYDPASGTYLGYDGLRHPCP